MTRPNYSFDIFDQIVRDAISLKKQKKERKEKLFTIGVLRPKQIFFCDIDSDNIDVYKTKDGFHIVSELDHAFDYSFDRLRVAPKYDSKGIEVNPAPSLILCSCKNGKHKDKRLFGNLEFYATNTS
ncbi:MAG: hypothetical protein ACYCQJ_10460 [Nitrososphaerales archaeon]